jgi:class 3 adenylate cyclase/tetratricopeptide (TPR) repeat protein
MQRQLAAILFADIVGYTRLMDTHESATHSRLMALLSEVVEPAIERNVGRIVKNTGDGFLARFESVNGAITAAADIQQEVNLREADRPHDMQIAFRMGLHSGDIVTNQRDIYGAGVNLAARLQEDAAPGNILISGAVYEQLGSNLKLPTRDLGFKHLKNIAKPVRVFEITLVRDGSPPAVGTASSLPHSRPSIAVLPFLEFGAAAGERYLGDGLVEDIIGALASLPDIFVISRGSTLKYRKTPPDVQSIAKELGVRYVLWGSIRRRDEVLRISAELSDAETQEVIAQHRVDGNFADLFSLQDRLVGQVLQKITPNIRDSELRRMRRKRPENFDAYDYMLRGLDLLYRLERIEFERARHMFEKSIALDPDYSAPRAFLALWHSLRLNQGWSTDQDRDLDRLKVDEHAAAALRCDPNDVWALSLSGHLRALFFRDFETAFAMFDRALHASPNSAFAWSRSSPAFSYVGDAAEARRRAEQALQLSPFDPHLFFTHGILALALYTGGEYEAATTWARRSYAENPRHTPCLRFLAASLAATGRLEEARHIGENLRRLEPEFRVRTFCNGYAYQEPEFRDRMARHLILAGMPE